MLLRIRRSRRPSKGRRFKSRAPLLALTVASLTLLVAVSLFQRRHSSVNATSTVSEPRAANFSGMSIITAPFAQHIIVSEVSRIMFCPIPKAANSNWKYLIRKWEGLPDYADLPTAHSPLKSGLRYLTDYSVPEAEQLLLDPTYFRFVFVRDPYLRLVSCYMDKFRNEDPEYVRREYRAFLAQLFGWRYARDVDIEHAPRPSFRAFVDELEKHSPATMNAHWMPQTFHCGIGVVPYDFVGRMENLQEDARQVFDRIGKPHEHFPTQAEIGFAPSGASKKVADGLYTGDLMTKVRAIYTEDFRILGYA